MFPPGSVDGGILIIRYISDHDSVYARSMAYGCHLSVYRCNSTIFVLTQYSIFRVRLMGVLPAFQIADGNVCSKLF